MSVLLTPLAAFAYVPDYGKTDAREQAISIHSGETHPVARACNRLAAAVAQLEAAVDLRASSPGNENDADLREAKAEAKALRAAHDAISERLDTAIERLRTLLKE